jgi:hypothetical protein
LAEITNAIAARELHGSDGDLGDHAGAGFGACLAGELIRSSPAR